MKLRALKKWFFDSESARGLRKFVKFGLVGVLNTGVDFGIYLSLTRFFPFFGSHYVIANTISYSFATLNSFFINKSWTFRDKDGKFLKQYPKFFLIQLLGLVIANIIIHIGVEVFGLYDIIAKVLSIVVTMLWNFFLNQRLVFNK
ncbi:GtrA family protein [Patescibacteria group bacterium]|nr:GtrA family protein [Patescibacteria group bacterium]